MGACVLQARCVFLTNRLLACDLRVLEEAKRIKHAARFSAAHRRTERGTAMRFHSPRFSSFYVNFFSIQCSLRGIIRVIQDFGDVPGRKVRILNKGCP